MDKLSGPNISHPYRNRPLGYVRADEGPSDPQARLEYMLQRLAEERAGEVGVMSDSQKWAEDPAQLQADRYRAYLKYGRVDDPSYLLPVRRGVIQ